MINYIGSCYDYYKRPSSILRLARHSRYENILLSLVDPWRCLFKSMVGLPIVKKIDFEFSVEP